MVEVNYHGEAERDEYMEPFGSAEGNGYSERDAVRCLLEIRTPLSERIRILNDIREVNPDLIRRALDDNEALVFFAWLPQYNGAYFLRWLSEEGFIDPYELFSYNGGPLTSLYDLAQQRNNHAVIDFLMERPDLIVREEDYFGGEDRLEEVGLIRVDSGGQEEPDADLLELERIASSSQKEDLMFDMSTQEDEEDSEDDEAWEDYREDDEGDENSNEHQNAAVASQDQLLLNSTHYETYFEVWKLDYNEGESYSEEGALHYLEARLKEAQERSEQDEDWFDSSLLSIEVASKPYIAIEDNTLFEHTPQGLLGDSSFVM